LTSTESEAPTNPIISGKTRRLAITAGCFIALAGTLSVGPLFFIFPLFLILGAITQPMSPRQGTWLVWAGAAIVSLFAVPLGGVLLSEYIGTLHSHPSYHPYAIVGQASLWAVSIVLVIWCDVALAIESRGIRRSRVAQQHRARGTSSWVVWLAALILNVSFLPASVLGVSTYHRVGRLDILLFSLASGVVITLFDVALVVDTVKSWRARRGPR
jgi:hypothetical protein